MRNHRLWIPLLVLAGAAASLVVGAIRGREDLTVGACSSW